MTAGTDRTTPDVLERVFRIIRHKMVPKRFVIYPKCVTVLEGELPDVQYARALPRAILNHEPLTGHVNRIHRNAVKCATSTRILMD